MAKRYVLHSYYPTFCLAHGLHDWEHYYVRYYDMNRKVAITKNNYCDAGCCDTIPFDFEKETELFDSMDIVSYWRHCGVDESLIQKAIQNREKENEG